MSMQYPANGIKRLGLLLPLQPLRRRPRLRARQGPAVGPGGLDQHQTIRVSIGRRREQDALDQAENRRRRADSQGQRQHGNRRESRLLPQHSRGKTQVLHSHSPPARLG